MSSLNMLRTARLASRSIAARSATRPAVTRSYASQAPPAPEADLPPYESIPAIPRGTLPARGWDDMLERRNFGEPIHEQEELLSMWGPDIPVTDPQTATRHFLIAVASFVSFGLLVKYALTPDAPAIRREYPFNGLVKELGGLEENKARPESLDDE